MNRRSFLAATVLAPFAGALAAENNLRIRIGQIGTSHSHAAGKMGALRALSHLYEVVGIAEPIAGREAMAEEQKAYAGLNWLTEEALLSDSSVEAIVVEASLADSPRAAQACLRAGKHIHLDKPGAASHAKFRALRLEAERRRLTVQLGYVRTMLDEPEAERTRSAPARPAEALRSTAAGFRVGIQPTEPVLSRTPSLPVQLVASGLCWRQVTCAVL